jgi:hypothetical protein
MTRDAFLFSIIIDWLLGYLTTLFQLQSLHGVEWGGKETITERVRILRWGISPSPWHHTTKQINTDWNSKLKTLLFLSLRSLGMTASKLLFVIPISPFAISSSFAVKLQMLTRGRNSYRRCSREWVGTVRLVKLLDTDCTVQGCVTGRGRGFLSSTSIPPLVSTQFRIQWVNGGVAFGGLVVSLPLDPRFAGSNPAEDDGF